MFKRLGRGISRIRVKDNGNDARATNQFDTGERGY